MLVVAVEETVGADPLVVKPPVEVEYLFPLASLRLLTVMSVEVWCVMFAFVEETVPAVITPDPVAFENVMPVDETVFAWRLPLPVAFVKVIPVEETEGPMIVPETFTSPPH